MRSLIVFLALVCAAAAQVDWSRCGWEHGTTKSNEWCPNGYVATGACACKGSKKCDSRSAFSIRCCKLQNCYDGIGRYNCHTQGGAKGVNIECPNGQAVFGTCSSLDFSKCPYNGKKVAASVECCDSIPSLKLSWTDCHWMYASNSGTHLTCPNGQVMTGRCGSESFANCKNGRMTSGIKCCKVLS